MDYVASVFREAKEEGNERGLPAVWNVEATSFFATLVLMILTLSQQTLYIYHAPSKARNANVIYISH